MDTSQVIGKVTVHYRSGMGEEMCRQIASSALGKKIASEYLFLDRTIGYYSEYHEGKYIDKTFYVFCGEEPILVCWCLVHDRAMGYFHLPTRTVTSTSLPEAVNRAARAMLQEVEAIIASEQIKVFRFSHDAYLAAAYFSAASVKSVHTAVIDLRMEEEQLRSNLRKSYKSLINWGQREMETKVMDKSNADYTLFASIRDFHVGVAGRKTRSDASWQQQYESVMAGEAFVVYSKLNGKLASAALILHGTEEAFYGVGINDRELMKVHPVSHYPLYHAIMHAKRIGLIRFNMNEIDSTGDEKQDNISAFKKGFTKTLIVHAVYSVRFDKESTES